MVLLSNFWVVNNLMNCLVGCFIQYLHNPSSDCAKNLWTFERYIGNNMWGFLARKNKYWEFYHGFPVELKWAHQNMDFLQNDTVCTQFFDFLHKSTSIRLYFKLKQELEFRSTMISNYYNSKWTSISFFWNTRYNKQNQQNTRMQTVFL